MSYHVTEDLVDHAISSSPTPSRLPPSKPFFMYFCTGAMHAPHHVRKEVGQVQGSVRRRLGRLSGTFARQKELGVVPADAELSRHDPDVKPWDECSSDERKLYARMMEVFAGFLEHTDHHIGRLLDFLKMTGQLDNTLIMLISDNGASSEGGPTGSVNENSSTMCPSR